jgi:GR25 family glycosyltransferase involved in LPS biosynthesis
MNTDVQIIVISCSDERRSIMMKQFSDLNIPYPIKYLEGSTPDNSIDFLPNNTIPLYNRKLCCTRSHIRAILEATKNDSPPYTIVMEDDASLHTTEFVPIVNKLINIWDDTFISPMISIGWVPWEYFQYPCHGLLEKCFNLNYKYKYSYRKVAGTQAYIIKRDWIKNYTKLINQPTFHSLHDIIKKTIDNPHEYDIGTADFLLPLIFKPAVLSPPIVIEYINKSLIDSTVDRNNVIWRHIFQDAKHERDLYWAPIAIKYKNQNNKDIVSANAT